MPDLKTQPDQIREWLRSTFGGADVDVVHLSDRVAYLFRVLDRDRSPFPRVILSQMSLEDSDEAELTRHFEQQRLVEQLKRSPETVLFYRSRTRTLEPYED